VSTWTPTTTYEPGDIVTAPAPAPSTRASTLLLLAYIAAAAVALTWAAITASNIGARSSLSMDCSMARTANIAMKVCN